MYRRGLSLVETLISIFLLVGAALAVLTLFQNGLRYTVVTEQKILAGCLARKLIGEIRLWARQPANFSSSWSPYTNTTLTDPDYPGMSAQVSVSNQTLASPCSQFESLFPAARQRLMRTSCKRLEMRVQWGAAGSNERLDLLTLVGEPVRSMTPAPTVQVTGVAGPLGPLSPGASANVTANVTDSGGQLVGDVFLHSYVIPGTNPSTATLTFESRDGTLSTLTHQYVRADGSTGTRAGQVQVRTRARYRMLEIWGYSPDVDVL